jgi:hypothetical protein
MALFGGFFDPPASKIPPPQFASPYAYGATLPQQFGYTAPTAPTSFAPTGMPGAEASWLGGISGLGGFNTWDIPGATDITRGLVSAPGAGDYMAGADVASGLGRAGALGAFGAGGGLMGLGGDIARTAFDPRQDLYNRLLQQTTDASRAGAAARGLAMTPYSAGLESQDIRNLNIDWQNQQLQRQIAGGQAAGGLTTAGAGLQAGAPGQYLMASGLPYSTYQQIGRNQMGALTGLGQFGQAAAQLPQQQIQDWNSYLQWAGQMQQAANAARLAQYYGQLGGQQQAFGQAQTAGFTDPMAMTSLQNQQQMQQFQAALAADKQAAAESQAMWGGVGKLAGAGLGFAFGGPMGAMMGANIGGGLGGGGGGGGSFAGLSGMNSQPFGGMGTSGTTGWGTGMPNWPGMGPSFNFAGA